MYQLDRADYVGATHQSKTRLKPLWSAMYFSFASDHMNCHRTAEMSLSISLSFYLYLLSFSPATIRWARARTLPICLLTERLDGGFWSLFAVFLSFALCHCSSVGLETLFARCSWVHFSAPLFCAFDMTLFYV